MKKVLLSFTMLLFLAGCAVGIQTTGFLDRSLEPSGLKQGGLFAVQLNEGAPNPILDTEIRDKIEKLLLRRGYRIAEPDQAKYLIQFSYGMNPKFQHSTTTVYGPSQTHLIEIPDSKGGTRHVNVTTPGDTFMVPTVTEIFSKHLSMKVLDAGSVQGGQKKKVVWIGETAGADLSSDLRYDMDYLLTAAFACFGQDTGRQLTISIGSDNADLRELRKDQRKRAGVQASDNP
jgi:hypothetical protein